MGLLFGSFAVFDKQFDSFVSLFPGDNDTANVFHSCFVFELSLQQCRDCVQGSDVGSLAGCGAD